MTHEFKAGDKVIVLPAKWDGGTEFAHGRGHYLQPYSICRVWDTLGNEINCEGYFLTSKEMIDQTLQPHQLQPLPIPYYLLDAE